ncbi:hypothetical protein F0562_031687 [Nyssa sinensis]|uniref:Uncharacterized protein n=1 Tax=Nyssa sinensis TaxID=561372 RepID=A0A5J5AV01_9ASTE|nr:hypothetical protein F0562_031687 [Nyssa sinensis]
MPPEVAEMYLQRWQSQASRTSIASRDGRAKPPEKAYSIARKGSENQLEQPLADKTIPALNGSTSNVVDSLDQNNLESLVSPSPLVSWHVGGPTASSRPLFSLTPLPRPEGFSSRLQGSYISVPENIILTGIVGVTSHLTIFGDMRDDLLKDGVIKPTPSKPPDSVITTMESTVEHGFVSPPKVSKMECSVLVMTTCHHKNNRGVCKSTPLPVAIENFSGSQNSDSSSSQVSEHLALKYPELFGLKPAS